ncbi:MAG: SecDF P1 head subdomain-containing protein [Solirubrobacteraceae bacterium]
MSSPQRSRHRPAVVPVLSIVVVLAVVAVLVRSGGAGHSAGPTPNAINLTLQALPTAQTPVITSAAMAREVHILRERLASVQGSYRVTMAGGDRISVTSTNAKSSARARVVELVTERAELLLYDWEANALTPNGKTVASQLQIQDPLAVEISQGNGLPGGGGRPLYQAVELAAKQSPQPFSKHLSRLGPQYYEFGAPGSAACVAAARQGHYTPIQGEHCLLSGPDTSIADLDSGLPSGVAASAGTIVTVPQGTVVLQAANPSASEQIGFDSPSAQFYVLRDDVALRGQDITNPAASTDSTGEPDVQFGFTSSGQAAFSKVTGEIAQRGNEVSSLGHTYDQHFAVALDNQLVTVPYINYKEYPDGIIGGGAEITAGLTKQSARRIATELRLGALPLQLHLVR